jgi:hypothetical protein
MKKILLMAVWCLSIHSLTAQDYFIKTVNIDGTSSDNGLGIVAEENGYVVLCGSIVSVGGIGIFKTDWEGNKIWDNVANFFPNEAGVRTLTKLVNGDYVISGGKTEPNMSFQDLFTFVNGTTGSIYRYIIHGDTMDNRAPNSLLRGDKIIAYTSIKQPGSNLSQYNNTLLITMDSSGVILREDTLQNIAGFPMNGAEQITLLPDTSYILGIGAQNVPDEIYGYLRKTDTIGNTLWEKRINDNSLLLAPIHLATLKNGNFVVSWVDSLGGTTQNRGSYFVRCYNVAGDSLWQYTFASIDYGRNIQDLYVCANGDIIGCGYTGNFDITGSPTCWLFRLSPNGELIWWREYIYWDCLSQFMLLYALTEDANGDIVATGYANRPDDNGLWTGQAVLLKVNSMGCFGQGGCQDTSIVHSVVTGMASPPTLAASAESPIRVLSAGGGNYWAFCPLSLQQTSLLFYDLSGKQVATHTLSMNKEFSHFSLPASLPAGLYVYVAEQKGNIVARGKVVVPH